MLASGNGRLDTDFVPRAESDSMMEVMKNSLMNEFGDQRSDKATLFLPEPSTVMRLFNSDWVRRLEDASKDWADENARLTVELEA